MKTLDTEFQETVGRIGNQDRYWCGKMLFLMAFFSTYHTFSVGFRSELRGGQRKRGISFLCFQFSVDPWIEALLSWKGHSSPPKYLAITAHRFAPSTSMYLALFIFPATNTKGPTPWQIVHPQTTILSVFFRLAWRYPVNIDLSIFQTSFLSFFTPPCGP